MTISDDGALNNLFFDVTLERGGNSFENMGLSALRE